MFILFKLGCSPLALSWASLVTYAILGLVIKPILINRIANYNWKEILDVYWVCLKVTLVAVPIPLALYYFIDVETIVNSVIVLLVSLLSVGIAVWYLGLTKSMRDRLLEAVKNRLPRVNH